MKKSRWVLSTDATLHSQAFDESVELGGALVVFKHERGLWAHHISCQHIPYTHSGGNLSEVYKHLTECHYHDV